MPTPSWLGCREPLSSPAKRPSLHRFTRPTPTTTTCSRWRPNNVQCWSAGMHTCSCWPVIIPLRDRRTSSRPSSEQTTRSRERARGPKTDRGLSSGRGLWTADYTTSTISREVGSISYLRLESVAATPVGRAMTPVLFASLHGGRDYRSAVFLRSSNIGPQLSLAIVSASAWVALLSWVRVRMVLPSFSASSYVTVW